MKTVLLVVGLSASSVLTAQVNPLDSDANQSTPAPQAVAPYQRPVSLGRIIPNIVDDQSKIWLFPAKLNKKRNWIPVAVILGTATALITLDSHDAPYFRTSSTFAGFNRVFTGNATAVGTAIVPVSLYAAGIPLHEGFENRAARSLRRYLAAQYHGAGASLTGWGLC
jgi:hypothetical protein